MSIKEEIIRKKIREFEERTGLDLMDLERELLPARPEVGMKTAKRRLIK